MLTFGIGTIGYKASSLFIAVSSRRPAQAPFSNHHKTTSPPPPPSPPLTYSVRNPAGENPTAENGAAARTRRLLLPSRLRRGHLGRFSGVTWRRHHPPPALPLFILFAADASDMLPDPLLPPPTPTSLVLIGYSSVPSESPSATPSSSIGSSVAIVAAVVIATAILTCAIVVFLRSSRRRRLSCSSFSHRRSFSRRASSSASSTEGQMQCAEAVAIGASHRSSASTTFLEMAQLPSAPSLPEVERVILELLSLPPVLAKPGSSTSCFICTQAFLSTDVLLALPLCSHTFHQSCIVAWLRSPMPPHCPVCYTSITFPCPAKTSFAPTFSSEEYDIEAQMILTVPASPGEEVAEAVGGSTGWIRSSMDRLSGSWKVCSSNRATAVVVPVSSCRTTRSWSPDSVGHLGIELHGVQTQIQPAEEEVEAVGGTRGWLRSPFATLSSSWSGCSSSHSSAMVLPVSSCRTTGRDSLGSSGSSSIHSCSRSCDPEAAVQKSSVFDYVTSFLGNSG